MAVLLFVCDLVLLVGLILRQEYFLFQMIVFSQVWILLSLIPFMIRGEHGVDGQMGAKVKIFFGILLSLLGVGVTFGLGEVGVDSSSSHQGVFLLLAQYGDMIPVVGIMCMASALLVASFSRKAR